MNYSFIKTGSSLGLLIGLSALSASAQKLEEKDLRTNIIKIENSSAQLNELEPITFHYSQKNKAMKFPSGQQYGFSTENINPSSPLLENSAKIIESGKNSTKVISYSQVDLDKLIPIMVGALKEQQAEIEALKSEIHSLKNQTK
jgi:hypothetical protein